MNPERTPGVIVKSEGHPTRRIMLAIPLTGLVRAEWMIARYGQVIPCNWSQAEIFQWIDQYSPLGYCVADARNMSVKAFIEEKYDWLFFIDHDVIIPPGTILWLNDMMREESVPIFGGLYFTKSAPAEPLIYRGKGTGYYDKWKFGDKVWVDGMGLGCHMLHRSVMQAIWDESPEYMIGPHKVRRVFNTPASIWYDPEKEQWCSGSGTEDLDFYWRLKDKEILKKAGWSELAKQEYPYLCDTKIFCKHITMDGTQYPACGEEKAFERET